VSEAPRATGRCLCGSVAYEVHGPLRDVIVCHCVECRRWHGHVCAMSEARREHLVVADGRALRWVTSPDSDEHARRGFCSECGSSLFWDAPAREGIGIAAGTLDEPTGLRTVAHWYAHSPGDYYELPEDGLPRLRLSP
jgi:hypothetical protein